MEEKTKYIFIELKERNGEYEYRHKIIHELLDNKLKTAKLFVKNYLKEFYGGKPMKEDDGYYFHGGEVFVRIYTWNFISQEEYNTLRKFL
jgi:hypothetical protein